MIEIPTFGGDVTLLEVGTAIVLFVTGYIIHETMHILPLTLWGHDYDIQVLPTREGQSKLTALFMGTVVEITTAQDIPRSHVIVSALAPGVVSIIPLAGLVVAFSYPVVDIGTFVILFAWFAVSIPSLRDWLTVFQYDGPKTVQATEVQP